MTEDKPWTDRLDAAIQRKFKRKTTTFYDLLGSMRYITAPDDNIPLTDEHHEFIRRWMKRNKPHG